MKLTPKQNKLIFFITEIFQLIAIVMGGIMLLWMYAPYGLGWKIGLTTFATVVFYDVMKSFVIVRWALWKEEE